MADQDELRLRIVPELDQQAKKQVEDELSGISGSVPVGGKGKGGTSDPEAALRKQRLADYRAEIDLIDLTLRKTTAASQRRQQVLEQEASSNQRSLKETAQLIAQEENLRENATASAIQGFDRLEQELTQLNSTQQDVINRQKQLFFASERAKNGFTTMSGSMTGLVSNTKSANIAFANFGRIVQDAPFGLLGISNNIDPLLVSFDKLKQESGGAGKALLKMGKELIGPAGLIFLLGSALPTALLFAQKYFKDTEKESNLAADAVKRVNEEFAKLSAQAAGKGGLQSVTEGLNANAKALDTVNAALNKYEENERIILGLRQQDTVTINGVVARNQLNIEQRERLNQLAKENQSVNATQLRSDKAIIEASTAELELTKAQIEAQNDITSARKRYGIAVALTAEEEKKLAEERAKDAEDARRQAELTVRADAERVRNRGQAEQALSKIFDDELTQRIKAEQASVRELLSNDQLFGDERVALQTYYDNIASRLRDEHNARVLKEETESNDRLLKEQQRAADEASRTREQEERRALQDARERQSIEAMVAQDMIALMYASGRTIQAIDAELVLERTRIRQEYEEARKTGLVEESLLESAEADALAEAEISAERKKMDARIQMGNMAANAVIGGLTAAFGQSKGIKAAEVAVQSITAAYEAFSSMQAQFGPGVGTALGVAAAAGILAKGRQSIKEIYATKPGSRGASSSGASSSPSVPSAPKFVNDLGTAGQVAGTITPFGASMTPNISITANLDRQGLALAVRDGESDIATRQIPFAS
jgi:hypothetical protein